MAEILSYARTPELWNELKWSWLKSLELVQYLNFLKVGHCKANNFFLVSYASLTERQCEGNSDSVLFFNQSQRRSSVLIVELLFDWLKY